MGKVWTKQPPAKKMVIDKSNSLSRGLYFLYAGPDTGGDYGVDLVSRVQGVGGNSPASDELVPMNTSQGRVLRSSLSFDETDTHNLEFTIPDHPAGTGVTIFIKYISHATSAQEPVVLYNNGFAQIKGYIKLSSTTTWWVGSGEATDQQGPVPIVDSWQTISYSRVHGTSNKGSFYQNGIHSIPTDAATTTSAEVIGGVSIINGTGAVQASLDGDIAVVAIWDREITPTEHQAMHDNPWQIFERKPRFALTDMPADVRLLIAPKPWTKQPPAGTQIDWTNPLTQGLIMAFPMNEGSGYPRDIVNGYIADDADLPNWEVTNEGRSINTSVINNVTSATGVKRRDAAKGLTLFGLLDYNGSAGNVFPVEWHNTVDGKGYGIYIDQWDTDEYRLTLRQAQQGSSINSGRQSPKYFGAPISAVATVDSAGNAEIWADGRSAVTGSLTEDLTTGDNNHIINLVEMTTAAPADNIWLSAVWERVLSEAEIESLHENPWQIFKPESIYATYPYVPAELGGPDGRDRLFTFKRPWK